LGSYDPRTKVYILKEDRIKYWLGQGAEATNTVFNMLIDKGILTGAKKKTASIVKPEAPAVEAAPAVVETAPAAEVAPAEAAPVAEEVVEEKSAETAPETPAEEAPVA
jgi:small subunit ribosomal protein S16